MGLDDLELILALERDLCISIGDADVGHVTTVGDLYDVLLRRLGLRQEPVCLTSRVFYRLRHGLVSATGCERSAVRPQSQLETLLPRRGRRRIWMALREASVLPLPALQRPRYLIFLLGGLGLAVAARTMLAMVGPDDPVNATMLLTAAALALMVGILPVSVLWLFGSSAARLLPRDVKAVEDLVRGMAGGDASIRDEHAMPASIDRKTVWDRLVLHTARIAHVPVESIHSGTRFGKDLGF